MSCVRDTRGRGGGPDGLFYILYGVHVLDWVESAIGARRIRSILKSGMCSLTTFLQGFFCSDDGFEQLSETAAQSRRQNNKIPGGK